MRSWMLTLPSLEPSSETEADFRKALVARDASTLPISLPRWRFLTWLTQQGWLLHGSARADLKVFEPRTPVDLSPDEFSKRTAVFAASDGVWAMMYALADRSRITRMLNMALQVRQAHAWSDMYYFLSLAPRDPAVTEGRGLLRPGSVYVLSSSGFEQMPPYRWPDLGEVLEPHWACHEPVRPVMRISVSPADFPLLVRTHNASAIDALSQTDPWGFPWLDPSNFDASENKKG